ncbi:MAG: flagellar hook-length control protein FliK [Oscillospiraceae bacterium]|nr:flagellar hook-length control protein FliK [Oscillospiraceae bacterium]
MAVAFSTGSTGYMRSDFMISDAAIPQRVEEAVQAEQNGSFSQVLSGTGGKADVPKDTVSMVEKFTGEDGRVDMQQLALAVADGEVRLEDIPEELLTQELFTELTKLVKVPDDDSKDAPTKEAAQEAMQELAALFTQQQTVQPEVVSDKTGELSELAEVGAVQPQTEEVPEFEAAAQPVQQVETVQDIPTENKPVELTQDTQQTADVPAEVTEQTAAAVKTAQPEQPQQSVQEQTEKPTEQPQVTAPQAPQQENSTQQSGAQLSDQQGGQQFTGQEQSDIKSFTVRKPQEQPAETAEEAPVFTEQSQRSRVVSKSDELEMIRTSQDTSKTEDSAAQAQPQELVSERPVVFTRADGGEIEVKPAEVASQVADRLIERSSDLREGETEYTVMLEPQDLGRITVRMTKTADGAVSVSIAAENSRTLRIIEENGAHIQDSLKQNGVQLENWQTVSESRQEMHAEDYQNSSKNPYRESEGQNKEDDSDDKSFAELIASM